MMQETASTHHHYSVLACLWRISNEKRVFAKTDGCKFMLSHGTPGLFEMKIHSTAIKFRHCKVDWILSRLSTS